MAVKWARGWRRLAIVASLVWFVVFGGWMRKDQTDTIVGIFAAESCWRIQDTAGPSDYLEQDQAVRERPRAQNSAKKIQCDAGARRIFDEQWAATRAVLWMPPLIDIASLAFFGLLFSAVALIVRWVTRGFVGD